jgi:putative copper resistance protein D
VAGLVDVLLRGLTLAASSVVLGGIAWLLLVLRAEAHVKPDAAVARALRFVAGSAAITAAAQTAVMLVALGALADSHGGWPVALFLETSFARVALARVALGVVVGALALRMARQPAGRATWGVLVVAGIAQVGASAFMSHAVARVEHRVLLLLLDGVHQVAAAVWVGGLAHLTTFAVRARADAEGGAALARDVPRVVARFSAMAVAAVAALVLAGVALTWLYVREPAALAGTAYGVMVLSKVILLAGALGFALANFRAARAPAALGEAPLFRLFRFVEVELGLGLTVLFAAASLTSLPPAVDVREDRATLAEVAARFTPSPPRLTSPPVDELIRTADPLMAPTGRRLDIERAWSEYNHHWSGMFVLAMSVLAALERLGLRPARHWPLVFLGLAAFMFMRNDPLAWPLGPAGFWESLTLPDVLQHRAFVLMVVAFAVFEWMVRTGRLRPRPWAYVFPLLCAVGGGMLLTHSHAMFSLKAEFLTEVTHAPLGLLGAFAGWGRWLEVRTPGGSRAAGWAWVVCVGAVGLLLLFYREG